MKKSRIFLTAIAVFAIAGGVMAFRATKSLTTFYCCNPFNPMVCDVPVAASSTFDGGNGIRVQCSIIPTFCNNQNCIVTLKPAINYRLNLQFFKD